MTGILLALLGTLLLSFADAGKKRLVQVSNPYFVIWSTAGVGLVLNSVTLLATGLPQVDWAQLATILPFSAALIALGEMLFMTAIQGGELSLSMPFKCFGPVFSVFVAYFALGEVPSPFAAVGVSVTVFGAYLMFLDGFGPTALLAPLGRIFRHAGARFMILTTLVYPFLAILQKVGATACSPLFYFTLLLAWQFVLFGIVLWATGGSFLAPFRAHGALTLGTGVLWAVGLTSVFVSFNHTLVVYVAAIGQLQPLLTLPIAYVFFGEQDSSKRILPATLMVAGVLALVASR